MKTFTVIIIYKEADRVMETTMRNVVSITNQDGMIVITNKDETAIHYYNPKDVVKTSQSIRILVQLYYYFTTAVAI